MVFEKIKIKRELLSDFGELLFVVGVYGFLTNFAAWALFGVNLSVWKVLAFGILWYFVKAELPSLINRCFPKNNGGGFAFPLQ